MNKVISILLSVLMVFSLASVSASAAEKNALVITVANDLHYNKQYSEYSGTDYAEKDFSQVPSSGQLRIESELIIDTFFEEFKNSDSDILLLPGDLVDIGTKEEHTDFSLKLKSLESTGKRVYVVPGNHDYYGGVKPEEFASLYADFGYNEALAKDTASASYVVDLDSEYRLLAVDSCTPGSGEAGINEERKTWIKEQAEKAQKDGKKLVSMMHHNLLDHFIFGQILHPGAFVDSSLGLPELYAQYNVRYNFVAHTHAQDIKAYTGKNGVTVYDVLTSSLNLYPLPYRTVALGEEVKIRTEHITEVDMSSKQGIISENNLALASEDFSAYALACSEHGLDKTFDSYLSAERIKKLLKLDEESDPEFCEIMDRVILQFISLVDMPMYIKDSQGGDSLESYAKKINLDFTETDIKSFRDLAVFFYQQYVAGDESFGLFSAEYILLTASLTAIINQILADVTAEDYTIILDYLISYFNLRSLDSVNSYAGDAISRMKGIDIFVSALGNTILLHFSTDELPADNNVSLPGYEISAADDAELSIFDRIIKFFTDLFDYILRIFGVGK